MGVDWQKLLVAAGGTAAVGLALYYLLREEEGGASFAVETGGGVGTKETCLTVLREMIQAQTVVKARMETVAMEMVKTPMSFETLYEKVAEHAKQADPLESRGLQMQDLERMLEANHGDEEVKMLMMDVMGVRFTPPSAKSKAQSLETVKEIHKFMLKELEQWKEEFQARPDAANYEGKNIMIAAQAVLNSKVYSKYNLTSEDVEGATLVNQEALREDMEFVAVSQKVQQVMEQLLA